MDWITFIRLSHIIGTVLGAGGATFAEIFYLKAKKDGVINPNESDFLRITYAVLRIGAIILVLSGFAFLIFYRLTGRSEWLLSERLWAKLTIVLIIFINALIFQARKISVLRGSAISLTSWYAALILGVWRIRADYFVILIGYLIAIFIVALILDRIRKILKIPTP
jgi:hypothetical protein